jgi:Ran-binding protein 1
MAEQVKAADAPAPALSFGSFAKVESPSGGFDFKAPAFNANSAGLFGAPTKFGESPKKEGEKVDGENPEAQESTAEFTPVVQLDEVEVKTHEEEEDIDYKIRAKLFRFSETLLNKGSGKKEWIERGVGEVKLLKHRENSMVRVLMRQEKTMKIICNHVVDPRLELEPNVGSDRSWVWSAWDFSSGELEDTIFAIRFGNSNGAQEYKAAFEKAKAHMKALKDGADAAPDAAADEAAEALSGLSAGADKEKP